MPIGKIARANTFKGYQLYAPAAVEIGRGTIEAWLNNSSLWADPAAARKNGKNSFNCRVFAAVSDFNFCMADGLPETVDIIVVPDGYNADRYGLLYTDDAFEIGVNLLLKNCDWPIKPKAKGYSVHYTEQGMQGINCVSMETSDQTLIKAIVDYPGMAKKLGIEGMIKYNREQLEIQKKKFNDAIANLKSAKIGLRVLKRRTNDNISEVKMVFNPSFTMSNLANCLKEIGWKDDRRGSKSERNRRRRFTKDGVTISIIKRTKTEQKQWRCQPNSITMWYNWADPPKDDPWVKLYNNTIWR